MNYSAYYHVFPATFHVIPRKVDYFWDSVQTFKKGDYPIKFGPFFIVNSSAHIADYYVIYRAEGKTLQPVRGGGEKI